MNIRKRKQKGSSLLLVIMIFSVLTILGISVLFLTASAFKSRVIESAERRNRYFAESGIDIAYGELGKVVDKGIEDGNQSVQSFMNELNSILDRERETVKSGNKSDYINTDGTTNEDYVKIMQNDTFQTSYKHSVIGSINNWYDGKEKKYSISISNENYGSTNDIAKDVKVTINAKQDELAFKEIQYKGTTGSALTLNLSSDFKEDTMVKTISVNYSILLPNYKDIYYVETNKFKLPINAVWNKAFCIDGNLNIASNFEVNGDIYVKGKDGDDSGININGSGVSTTFTGNVSSFGGVQVSNKNNSLTVTGNVYAGNMLINDAAEVEGSSVKGASLTVNGAVYTNNDLAVNGEASIVNITSGFYGINDVKKVDNISNNQKPKVSSCLLVNAGDIGKGTSITIGREAILMGTAYIKTSDTLIPFYQTGESVAIKGNYRAYTNPISGFSEGDTEAEKLAREKLKEGNVIFEYINPLELVTKFKDSRDELKWQDKSDYFHLYTKDHKDDKELNLGAGITLPSNIIHIGSIVANNDTISGNFINDNDGNIKSKQDEYALKVYAMGDSGADDVNSTPIDLEDAFAKNELKRTIFTQYPDGEVNKSISQVDFTSSKFSANKLNTTLSRDIIYLNNDSAEDCIIVGKNAAIDKKEIKEERNINLDSAREIDLQDSSGSGILITRGNVYLAGEVKFKGTIISTGNIETLDDSKKTLNYDVNYIERLIAYNYSNYFKDVFIRNSVNDSQNIEVDSNVNKDSNAGSDVLRDKLIIMQKWKIIK